MLRAIAGVIVGYLVMAITVFATFTAAFLVMGTDGAFKEGSYEVSATWLVTSFALGLIAAVIGGLVCALVATRGSKAPIALATIVVAFGLLSAAFQLTGIGEDSEPAAASAETAEDREGDLSNMEAMMNAEQPAIALILNPFIGAVGVLIGARLRGGHKDLPGAE